MKVRWLVIPLSVFFLIGIIIFAQILLRQEKRDAVQDVLNKGSHLVSLIALYPIKDFDSGKRDFLLRTITEYISSEGLAYCLVHDHTGNVLLSIGSNELVFEIPDDIQMRSLYTTGITQQFFAVKGSAQTIYEFAKSMFEGGQRVGTVRLGLKLPSASLLSLDRIPLLAMIIFFIFGTGTFFYYGMTFAIRPIKKLAQSAGNLCTREGSPTHASEENPGVLHFLGDLEKFLVRLRTALKELETDNAELKTRLGITTFEKKQVSKIIDSIDFGIIIINTRNTITNINSYMLNLLNRKLEDVVDRQLGEALEHDEITSFVFQDKVAKQATNSGRIETSFPDLAPGEIFQVTSSYLKDSGGDVISKMILVKNITTGKSTENATHEFLAHVAHEFLTPLTTIQGYNEMLMNKEIHDGEIQKEFYNTISEETVRLTRLIKNLLNISKIQMGSLTLNKDLLRSEWLVNDCIGGVEVLAEQKHVAFEKNLPDTFPSLVGDKELLKVALINLLSNAIKYTPENGTVTFSLRDQDGAVLFEVSDNGYGIAKEDLPYIFDKFYRSKDLSIKEQTGNGLGLAMTKEIIRLHGGEIEVQSEIGEGAHFTIRIPKEEYCLGEQ